MKGAVMPMYKSGKKPGMPGDKMGKKVSSPKRAAGKKPMKKGMK